jgi:type I restriction enzyme M protein
MSEEERRRLQQQLWNIANTLRGKMGADEFRDYILGFIFYKYLSEKIQRFADGELAQENLKFAELKESTKEGQEYIAALEDAALSELGYFLKPSELFHAIAMKGSNQQDANNEGDSHNIDTWRREYNEERPKKSLGGLTPAAYAKTLALKSVTLTLDSKAHCY